MAPFSSYLSQNSVYLDKVIVTKNPMTQ